jgi:hypothetical protein
MEVALGDSTTTWARLRAGRVTGQGRVAPRLVFEIFFRTPRERMSSQVQIMRAKLIAGGETLGDGVLTGVNVAHGEYPASVEIPVTRAALDHFSTLVSGDKVDLALQLSGWLRARDDNEDAPRFASSPEPGKWQFVDFGVGRQTELRIQVARSDWYSQVLQPIGSTKYVPIEVAIPAGDLTLKPASNHLEEAERAYAEGDDPNVFARCRAATESLPGATKKIFASLPDPSESKALDELLLRANDYFHRGRHVVKEGDRQGEFPVTHADARFALTLAQVLVAHVAHLLSRKPPVRSPETTSAG